MRVFFSAPGFEALLKPEAENIPIGGVLKRLAELDETFRTLRHRGPDDFFPTSCGCLILLTFVAR
jgi:hypothetical protein